MTLWAATGTENNLSLASFVLSPQSLTPNPNFQRSTLLYAAICTGP